VKTAEKTVVIAGGIAIGLILTVAACGHQAGPEAGSRGTNPSPVQTASHYPHRPTTPVPHQTATHFPAKRVPMTHKAQQR